MRPGWDEKAVFLAALELPAAQRRDYLDRACPDAASRERVESLLAHHGAVTRELFGPDSADSGVTAPPPPELQRVDEFQIVRRLGEGGMGIVYLAEDLLLGRQVAIKVLAPHFAGSPEALARFRSEAQAMAAVTHPAIVPVFSFGFDGSVHYIVSEYVPGMTVADLLAAERARSTQTLQRSLWYRRCAEIVAVVADALEAAHRQGFIHRDVKPSNILLDEQRGPRLTDFGIAKHLGDGTQIASTAIIGTCYYMSPEQAAIVSRKIDQRSDLFSLGVVLYELLTLRRPFEGADVRCVLHAVLTQSPMALRSVERSIPRDLAVICHKTLEKAPADRYQSAAHVAADLRAFLNGVPILARPPGPLRRVTIFLRRRPKTVFTLTVAAALAASIWAVVAAFDRAKAQNLAWVQINTGPISCRVLLQRNDEVTLAPSRTPEFLGETPLPVQKLPVGQYRITLVRPEDGSFAEFNLVLRERGSAGRRTITLGDFAAPPTRENIGRTLTGVLRPPTPPAGMVLVPGGEYALGRGPNANDTLPTPCVIDAFYIDAHKVSNRDYAEYLAATGYPRPPFWSDDDPEAILDLPLIGISLEEAETYARWRGKRLPTVHEWQAAARTLAGYLYPGGDAAPSAEDPPELWRAEAASPSAERHRAAYRMHALAVHADDGFSAPLGVMQMYSNVRELCATVSLPNAAVFVVGRAWFDRIEDQPLNFLSQLPIDMSTPNTGFRCARSAAPSTVSNN